MLLHEFLFTMSLRDHFETKQTRSSVFSKQLLVRCPRGAHAPFVRPFAQPVGRDAMRRDGTWDMLAEMPTTLFGGWGTTLRSFQM